MPAFYWVDAFTNQPFRGNPAGVVPLEQWADTGHLQRIAFENGLAETAFFVRTGPDRFHLRWFTPTIEMDLCGHATLATAFVLFSQLGQTGEQVTFDTRSGPLVVKRLGGARLELDFPSRPAAEVARDAVPANLRLGLGPEAPAPVWIGQARDLVCVYSQASDVIALQPDFSLLSRIDVTGIIVTAPGESGLDFVSRFFAPRAGIPEDPVTGSSHCTLTPYWAERLGRTRLRARQVSARGGDLWCELAGDRVKIAGDCALYLRGEILV